MPSSGSQFGRSQLNSKEDVTIKPSRNRSVAPTGDPNYTNPGNFDVTVRIPNKQILRVEDPDGNYSVRDVEITVPEREVEQLVDNGRDIRPDDRIEIDGEDYQVGGVDKGQSSWFINLGALEVIE